MFKIIYENDFKHFSLSAPLQNICRFKNSRNLATAHFRYHKS